MGHVTWPCLFQGWLVMHWLGLTTMNLSTKFEVSIFISYELTIILQAMEDIDKNSSGDVIADVNLLTTISHTHVGLLQNTEKETNLLCLTNYTIDRQVLRMKSWILASATEFPPHSYIIYWWRRAVPLQTILVLIESSYMTSYQDDS